MSDGTFRSCGSCQKAWRDWRELVLDPGLRLLGLQIAPGMPEANLLVFEHHCGSSLSVLVSRLRPYLSDEDEPTDLPALFGTEACSGHCRLLEDLEACDQRCANARDRHLALAVLEAKRTGELPRRGAA
jgi:hypothetical protein